MKAFLEEYGVVVVAAIVIMSEGLNVTDNSGL